MTGVFEFLWLLVGAVCILALPLGLIYMGVMTPILISRAVARAGRIYQARRARSLGLVPAGAGWEHPDAAGVRVTPGYLAHSDTTLTVDGLVSDVRVHLSPSPGERFEDRYTAEGSALDRAVALRPEVQVALLALSRDPHVSDVRLDQGSLRVVLGSAASPEALGSTARALASLGRLLDGSPTARGRELLTLLKAEALTTLGGSAAQELLARLETPERREALALARRSPRPALRLMAALCDLDVTAAREAVGSGALDERIPEHLGDLLPPEGPWLARRPMALYLLTLGVPELILWSARALQTGADPSGDEIEGALLRAAAGARRDDERQALAEALGRHGTVRAVPILRAWQIEAAKAGASQVAPILSALREIQARLVGAEAGGLRLAEPAPEAGAIRVAEAAEGAVRIAAQGSAALAASPTRKRQPSR